MTKEISQGFLREKRSTKRPCNHLSHSGKKPAEINGPTMRSGGELSRWTQVVRRLTDCDYELMSHALTTLGDFKVMAPGGGRMLGRFSHFCIAIVYSNSTPGLQVFVSSLENCQNFSKTSTPLDRMSLYLTDICQPTILLKSGGRPEIVLIIFIETIH